MININNWLINKLKLSQYHWLWNSSSFSLNDENQSKMKEAKQNVNKTKKVTNQKESNCWNLIIHKKTKKKKKQSERHKYDVDHLRVRVRETNATMNYFP